MGKENCIKALKKLSMKIRRQQTRIYRNYNIKLGEYIRTIYGLIDKVEDKPRYGEEIWIAGEKFLRGEDEGYYHKQPDDSIISHSYNLIDVLEEGDYVNDYRVILKGKTLIKKIPYVVVSINQKYFEKDIRTVVTKEYFNSGKYLVKK